MNYNNYNSFQANNKGNPVSTGRNSKPGSDNRRSKSISAGNQDRRSGNSRKNSTGNSRKYNNSNSDGPYLCDRETFTSICELEKRRADRDWHSAYIIQVNIELHSGQPDDLEEFTSRMENVLQEKIRQCDTVCRWGEDRFLLLLHDLTRDDIATVMNRIQKYFNQSLRLCTETDCWFNKKGLCQEHDMPGKSGCDCKPPGTAGRKVVMDWDYYPLHN